MIKTENNKIGFIINLIIFGNCIFSFIISTIILFYNRIKQDNRITIIVCIYIYLFILICNIIKFNEYEYIIR
jgi:hypothetical protein